MNIEPTGSPIPVNPTVAGAIRNAAQVTGANFEYLLATARVESNLNPQSAAPTSSAKGLFQFISQTWLATLKEQGPALGYGRYADAIEKLPSGQYTVTDPKLHAQILGLRTDPVASATMAGAFTKSNTEKLSAWLGRAPNEGELYIAHFLGAGGAAKLIELAEARPQTVAAQVFPGAANANPSIFFDRQGQPRSVVDVYRSLVGRYDVVRANRPTLPVNVARQSPVPVAAPVPALSPVRPPAPVAAVARLMPAAAPLRVALPAARSVLPLPPPVPAAPLEPTHAVIPKPAAPPSNAPVFHSLFRTIENPSPVAPVVSALWGAPRANPAPAQPAAPPPTALPTPPAPGDRPGGPLDLFQEQAPDARALFRGSV